MKVLITHSYFLRFDPKQWELQQPYAPLGTMYAAAVLQNAGFKVSLFDVMFAENASEILAPLQKEKPDWFVIYDDGFNYLTKMCLTNMREAAFQMIQLAKSNGCKVAVSSSDSTDHYQEYLSKGADAVLLGEAEETLRELISLDAQAKDWQQIKGIACFNNNEIVCNARRQVIKNLDEIPFPAWNLVDIFEYKKRWIKKNGYFSINMGTTRGCPYKCNWCAKPIYGNRYNSRSAANVVAEIKMLKNKYAFDHIWFCDDIFGLKPGWVKTFADLLESENISFQYKIQSRVDLLLEDKQIADLARSGCANVWVGAESGSQKILDAMDKGTKVEQIYEATRLLKKNGIKPAFFIQFGYLGETMKDIELTIKMINDLLPEDIGVSVSYPLPGTKFFEQVKHQMTKKTNWSDSDDLALMFNHAYSPAFYKQLHRFVHKNYRKHQALNTIKDFFKSSKKYNFGTIKRAVSFAWYMPVTLIEKQKLKHLHHE
ncbi:MAG TPA: radical SAM protein [Bacteroidia bacterium]|nr:radical SAM protein [Bacteroidia bacterium]